MRSLAVLSGAIMALGVLLQETERFGESFHENSEFISRNYWMNEKTRLDLVFEYTIEHDFIKFSFSKCKNANFTIYYAQNSEFFNNLTVESIYQSLPFMNILLFQVFPCNRHLNYQIPLKGDLIFVTHSISESSSENFSIIHYESPLIFNCNFEASGKNLQILKNSFKIMLYGEYSRYLLFNHGDIQNESGIEGNLDHVLCGYNMEFNTWYKNCNNPLSLIGKKILDAENNEACIVEKNSIMNTDYNQGICRFNSGLFEGYLNIYKKSEHLEIIGFSNSHANFSIEFLEKKYNTSSEQLGSLFQIHLNITLSQIIGQKIKFYLNNSEFTCIIGKLNTFNYSNPSTSKSSPFFVFFLFTLTAVISVIIFRRYK